MYKIIVVYEDGREVTTENVLDYNFIDVDTVQDIAKDNGTELTEEEICEIRRRLTHYDELPDWDGLRWLVKDVLEERK